MGLVRPVAAVAAGDLSHGDRTQIDRAIRSAEQSCRFEFSVFVGRADGEPRAFAERLHAATVAPDRSVLLLVDPGARRLEVVTGEVVRHRLTDSEVDLAVLQMTGDFAEGDLVGGLSRGIAQLAEHARA